MTACLNLRHKFLAVQHAGQRPIWSQMDPFAPVFNRAKQRLTIHLESAAFVFHMSGTTPESSGHCEPRVLSPFNGFWLAPSAPKPTPQTRGCL
jgi:hypothetical protein